MVTRLPIGQSEVFGTYEVAAADTAVKAAVFVLLRHAVPAALADPAVGELLLARRSLSRLAGRLPAGALSQLFLGDGRRADTRTGSTLLPEGLGVV